MNITQSQKPHFPTRLIFVTRENKPLLPDYDADKNAIAVRYDAGNTLIYAGLGNASACTVHTIRTAAAKAVQKAIDIKRQSVSLLLPPTSLVGPAGPYACLEGALMGSYFFAKYKSEKPAVMQSIDCVGGALTAAALRRAETISSCVNYARDLTNDNADVIYPERLAREARAIARLPGVKATILNEKEIKSKGLGLLEAVGRGSPYPPRLIILEYNGASRLSGKTAIIGKGITFDSGGYDLKPVGSIEDMKEDMAGGATVLAAIKCLALLKAKVNVIGVVSSAHNAIDGRSYFPGDIYRSFAGKTVEITNTDAEGRLVLADAISYCQKMYHPSRMVDLATLTGGILTALGEFVAGLFSNNDALAHDLSAAGEATFERLWRFPIYTEYCESMKSDLADLRNTSKFKKGYASSITGAAFIQEFVEGIPWAHLDIAGTATNAGDSRGEVPKYATGFGVRLLIEWLSPVRA